MISTPSVAIGSPNINTSIVPSSWRNGALVVKHVRDRRLAAERLAAADACSRPPTSTASPVGQSQSEPPLVMRMMPSSATRRSTRLGVGRAAAAAEACSRVM